MALDLLLVSSSSVHGTGYLDHCEDQLRELFAGRAPVVFIPYARPGGLSHEAYTDRVRERLGRMGVEVGGANETGEPAEAVRQAGGVFIGGGNTFLLLRGLYEAGLVDLLRARVHDGMPYAGTSAGSNVAGLSIGTTNDMPIVYPPSFEALGLVPLNLNPHYLDPDPASTHHGETRETRIREFHVHNAQPVLGLREGAMLRVRAGEARLEGHTGARLFRRGEDPEELAPGADCSMLITTPP